jgi:YHS domain-containing protein
MSLVGHSARERRPLGAQSSSSHLGPALRLDCSAATITVMITPETTERPRDPVCGMAVRMDGAIVDGLVAEHDGHSYYFCRASCLERFTADPSRFITSHQEAAPTAESGAPIQIDAGMRLWYES